jgi:hypothetical protein
MSALAVLPVTAVVACARRKRGLVGFVGGAASQLQLWSGGARVVDFVVMYVESNCIAERKGGLLLVCAHDRKREGNNSLRWGKSDRRKRAGGVLLLAMDGSMSSC